MQSAVAALGQGFSITGKKYRKRLSGRWRPTGCQPACTLRHVCQSRAARLISNRSRLMDKQRLCGRGRSVSLGIIAVSVPLHQEGSAKDLQGEQIKQLEFSSARYDRQSGMVDARRHTIQRNGCSRAHLDALRTVARRG